MKNRNHYFAHDCNARNRDKLLSVRIEHSAAGYGVYFMILEKLMESPDHTLTRLHDRIAFDLQVPTELVRSVVEDFNLFTFTEDDTRYYSEGFNRRMDTFLKNPNQKREAGIKSGEARRKKKEKDPEHEIELPTNL